MKVAIMQPYLFPYVGYFQLINAVDKFVFYDDVNFIKGGWINRNRLLTRNGPSYFTIPLQNASAFSKINAIDIDYQRNWQSTLKETIRHSYSKTPFYSEVVNLIDEVLADNSIRIDALAKKSILAVCEYLNIKTDFVHSAACYQNDTMSGVNRIVDICKRERARTYINLPGGRKLYEAHTFGDISLRFVDVKLDQYEQSTTPFVPMLSILDMLMNVGVEAKKFLQAEVSE